MATPPSDRMIDAVLERVHQITRGEPTIDDQEMRDREDATVAYFKEDERHFVEYLLECVTTSRNAMQPIRRIQRECFAVYQEEEPSTYADKEDWQSRVVLPKPHSAVQFAKTQVRKAFSPEFLSIQNESNELAGLFWKAVMQRALDESHANFRICFPDATEMALAIGTSMEMIPYWDPARGLQYSLVEPWKIHRDPDARSRDPQSGMYWIHEEYQDLYSLAQQEAAGVYMQVNAVKDSVNTARSSRESHNAQNPEMDAEHQAELKKMLVVRNKYREMVLAREYWGVILDRKGNLLLPKHTYTIAGRKVISVGVRDPLTGEPLAAGPYASPYRTLRWPGVGFSPIPHLLRFDGRGIVQGVRSLWYWMCALMALHSDNLNWIVNPMGEINQSGLVDQSDVDIYPGHWFITKDTVSGQQVARTVDRRFITNEILANLEYGSQSFEEGTFVTSTIQGLPGYRNEITFREQAQNRDQSRDMFSTLGENVEDGALHAIRAGMETCMANMTLKDIQDLIGSQDVQEFLAEIQASGAPMEISPMHIPLPLLRGSFSVSGLTAVLKDLDVLKQAKDIWLPLAEHPLFAPYMRPYNILHSLETRTDVRDEEWLVPPKDAEQIMQQQQEAQAQAQQVQKQLIEAQMAAEQMRAELEAQKLQLEAQKLALEAQKMAVEAEMQQVEAVVDLERLESERDQLDQQIQAQQADIHKMAVEIGKMLLQSEAIKEKMGLDRAKLALEAHRTETQLALQNKQINAQIAAQQQQSRVAANGNRSKGG